MGIKENLAQPGNSLNIHEVTVQSETTKSELFFDIGKELGENDWQAFESRLESYRGDGNWPYFCWLAGAMKVFYPEESFQKLKIEKEFEMMKPEMNDRKNGSDRQFKNLINLAPSIKSLFPERFKELELEKKFSRMKSMINEFRRAENWIVFARCCCNIKILFPDKFSELEVEKEFDSLKKMLVEFEKSGKWEEFRSFAYAIKILFPQRFERLIMKKECVDSILEWRSTQGPAVFNDAVNISQLMVLSAKEIKITDHGLELIMAKRGESLGNIQKRPERLHF